MRLSTTIITTLAALAMAAPAPAPVEAIVNGDKIKDFKGFEKRDLTKISQDKVIVNGDELKKEVN